MDSKNKVNKEYKRVRIILCSVFFAILIAWGSLYGYLKSMSGKERVYTFEQEPIVVPQDDLSINYETSKSWTDYTLHASMPDGAQYDFTVNNESKYEFINWRVEIVFDGPVSIDDGWNGTYEVDDNKLKFIASEPINILPAKDAKPFGAILYTPKGCKIKSYVLSGYWNITLRKTVWFWVLMEISILYVLVLGMQIVYFIKTNKLRNIVEHDTEIIEQTMKTLTEFIDAKDAYTKDHSARVAEYAKEIGKRIGMEESEVHDLYYITLMHDCGKIGIPDDILKKEGSLTPEEFAIVKTHTTKGNELLKKFSALEGIGDGAHYHHERYDGYGYPAGLEAEEIPLYARIICVADAYDAMSSNRCYRKALGKEKILSELTLNSGKQFDPKFVPVMVSMIEDGFVDAVKEKYPLE